MYASFVQFPVGYDIYMTCSISRDFGNWDGSLASSTVKDQRQQHYNPGRTPISSLHV
jgi:hypothetical protein